MNHLETITKAVHKAVPEILELKFGCELLREEHPGRHYKVIEDLGWGANTNKIWINSVPFGSMDLPREIEKDIITDRNGEKWRILGRPIRLADILETIEKTLEDCVVNTQGHLLELKSQTETGLITHEGTGIYWNLLNDDLTQQSPETLEFLAKLLK